jgi:C1A family cysteine protease
MLNLFVVLFQVAFSYAGTPILNHEEIVKYFQTKIHSSDSKPRIYPMIPMERKTGTGRVRSFNLPKDVSPLIDLRYRDTASKRQFGSTCSSFGLVAAMENALNEMMPMDLSERHLWNKYRKYSSEKAIKTALTKGAITEEEYWPMNRWFPHRGYKKSARALLLEAPYIEDNIALALKALDANRPVYLGLSVTESLYACHKVVDPNSAPNGGGHAVSIVGYGLDQNIPGGGYFIIKNSWSADCGEKGYQFMPFNYCLRDDMYCIMWDIKKVGLK